MREYRIKNRKKELSRDRIRRKKNHAIILKQKRDFWIKHRDRLLTKKKIYHLNRRNGLAIDEYKSIFQKQKGGCAICGKTQAENTKNKIRLCVDHDHQDNKIRGLLCSVCNLWLERKISGQVKASKVWIKRAIKYINPELSC
jgi:hypothetical protein